MDPTLNSRTTTSCFGKFKNELNSNITIEMTFYLQKLPPVTRDILLFLTHLTAFLSLFPYSSSPLSCLPTLCCSHRFSLSLSLSLSLLLLVALSNFLECLPLLLLQLVDLDRELNNLWPSQSYTTHGKK